MSHYTLAPWRVREGSEAEFMRIWKEELAVAFRSVSEEARGVLIQSLDDPRQYYSFGPWKDLETMKVARADPSVREALGKLMALCEDARPGAFKVVLTIGPERGA